MTGPVTGPMTPARKVALARLVWASVLLAAPRAVLAVALPRHERDSSVARAVVAVLGVRNLLQGMVELAHPTRLVLRLAAAVDAIHALTFMRLATARSERRWRRPALLNVGTALAFSAATLRTATLRTATGSTSTGTGGVPDHPTAPEEPRP